MYNNMYAPPQRPKLGVPRGSKLPVGMIAAGALTLVCVVISALLMVAAAAEGMSGFDINIYIPMVMATALIVSGSVALTGRTVVYCAAFAGLGLVTLMGIVSSVASYVTMLSVTGVEQAMGQLLSMSMDAVIWLVDVACVVIGFITVLGRLRTNKPLMGVAIAMIVLGLLVVMLSISSTAVSMEISMIPDSYWLHLIARSPCQLLYGVGMLFAALSLKPMPENSQIRY